MKPLFQSGLGVGLGLLLAMLALSPRGGIIGGYIIIYYIIIFIIFLSIVVAGLSSACRGCDVLFVKGLSLCLVLIIV